MLNLKVTMLQPTKEQLLKLSWIERFSYKSANWFNCNLKEPFIWWNRIFMFSLIWLGLSRRLFVHGLDNIKDLDRTSSVVIAANHRTFFDFFVITWVNYTYTKFPRRIFFPVRSKFFYDTLIGTFLNGIMGGFAMFPPIMREEKKKHFNRFALDRLVNELETKPAVVGFHPEGRRNKDPNPYELLPARPGIGEIILRSNQITTVPVFIIGPTNNVLLDFWRNWFSPQKYPIHVRYGKPISKDELSELSAAQKDDHLKASELCMSRIQKLMIQHKNELSIDSKQTKADH
ncbi:MAG: hypothetical protein CMK59_13685 [Proteobacteria bacterium]|nr:hypothetical protein [Pseudomonadota bacterium]